MEVLNNNITDQLNDVKKQFRADHFITIQAKTDVDFMLKNDIRKIRQVK